MWKDILQLIIDILTKFKEILDKWSEKWPWAAKIAAWIAAALVILGGLIGVGVV